jgi:hypothetical protein
MPDGLTLASDGTISGTPTTSTTTPFTVTFTDGEGKSCTQTVSLTVTGACTCDWPINVLPSIVDPGGCTASPHPAWGGVFTNTEDWSPGLPAWYFTGKSLLGLSVSADESIGPPAYPNPGWISVFEGTQMWWDGAQWWLGIYGNNGGSVFWEGTGSSLNPLDPTGAYTFTSGSSTTIGTLYVKSCGSGYCVDNMCQAFGAVVLPAVPASWSLPQPAQIRIANYDPTLFGACAGCAAAGFPAWDGTLPARYAPNNFVEYYNPVGTDIGLGTFPQFNVQGKGTINSSLGIACYLVGPTSWEIRITCADNVLIWSGAKFYGDDPTGVYVRRPVGVQYSSGPQCLTIEAY